MLFKYYSTNLNMLFSVDPISERIVPNFFQKFSMRMWFIFNEGYLRVSALLCGKLLQFR